MVYYVEKQVRLYLKIFFVSNALPSCSFLEVEDNSEGGTGSGSHFLHLLGEVFGIAGWEVLEDLGHGGELSDEDEHVLGKVLGDLGDKTVRWVVGAHAHEVESALLEVALGKVLKDLGTGGELLEVSLDVSDVIEHLAWVIENLVVHDDALDGVLIEALLSSVSHMGSVEGGVVSLVEALDSVNVPGGVLDVVLVVHASLVEEAGVGGTDGTDEHSSESHLL